MLNLIIDFDCENYGQRPSSCTISKYFEGLMTVDVSSDSNCGPNVKFAFDALRSVDSFHCCFHMPLEDVKQ